MVYFNRHCIKCTCKQRGGSDCGLFSIAFATAICFKINPVAVDFRQEDLRGHLFMCLENRKMVPFPSRKKKIENCLSKVKISVYCECRQIEIGRMIMCDGCQEWYHQGCVYSTSLHVMIWVLQ